LSPRGFTAEPGAGREPGAEKNGSKMLRHLHTPGFHPAHISNAIKNPPGQTLNSS